jgi:two-component system chemotaxis sensor kinase CheA
MMARVFRAVHTIKGTCGFLALPKLEKVAHAGENLLCGLRDGRVEWCPEVTGGLLRLIDALRTILGSVERGAGEGGDDYPGLLLELEHLRNLGKPPRVAGQAVVRPVAAAEPVPPAAKTVPAAVLDAPTPEAEPLQSSLEEPPGRVKGGNVRVDVGLLDKLMNLVGELVLARNQIIQHTASHTDARLLTASQRLNLLTSELQEGVMKARMQPIGNVFGKFSRVVRDLAAICGKQVRLEIEGRETELDRTIIEAIKDPLTHILRNSVDHGIESPEVRRERGKPEAGLVRLRAFHESGQVVIEVSDDGGGIDPVRVARKALERGLITAEQATRLTGRELTRLIFLPGFSTAEKVTNLSGRGVGMDVVKTNIEAIGGTVEVQSRHGEGTTLRVRIPLTLAIIPALIVGTGGERYVIPQVNLLELVRLDSAQARQAIEMIRDTPVYRLRGCLLPLVYLDRALGLPPDTGRAGASSNIVVLQADGRQFGLVVEGVHDTEEIVVKPLGRLLKGLPVYAGAAIMGDGRVALILDVQGLAREVNVDVGAGAAAATGALEGARGRATRSFLLCRQGGRSRLAVPIEQVARLEQIPAATVEQADGREVVQYRGKILPLVRLSGVFGGDEGGNPDGPLRVVVHAGASGGGGVGFVVDEIVDIVWDSAEVLRPANGPGLVGSTVIQNHVTDLLDFPGLLRSVDPLLLEGAGFVEGN